MVALLAAAVAADGCSDTDDAAADVSSTATSTTRATETTISPPSTDPPATSTTVAEVPLAELRVTSHVEDFVDSFGVTPPDPAMLGRSDGHGEAQLRPVGQPISGTLWYVVARSEHPDGPGAAPAPC